MTVYTGTQTDVGIDTANQLLVDLIATNLVTEGWVIEESSAVAGADREYILSSTGESTTDNIYIGLRSYQNASSDYYNISLAYFTGYVNGSAFIEQPGYSEKGICAHNLSIGYWIFMDKDHVRFGLDINNQAVYEAGFVGKYKPFASPNQYPYPVACIGSLDGQTATRFSDAHGWGFIGEQTSGVIRLIDGTTISPRMWPHRAKVFASGPEGSIPLKFLRDTNNSYPILPLTMHDVSNVYGVLQGFYYISGFNNSSSNTVVIDGVDYVVLRNVDRTGFGDYIALELD